LRVQKTLFYEFAQAAAQVGEAEGFDFSRDSGELSPFFKRSCANQIA
jgi:hypothetical protein